MSKKKKILIGLIVACAFFGGGVCATAAAGDPGSESDPLVSKSYVDSRISEALGGGTSANVDIDEIVREVLSEVNFNSGSPSSSGGYKTISIKEGTILTGYEGTEIILRSGIARAYIPGENGIADITLGKDIFNGTTIGTNHLLIVPRTDGRGLVAATDCWLMIKGGYEFLN